MFAAIVRNYGMSRLGVSRILVQGWERGVRRPSAMAARLLDTIRRDPAGWLASLRKAG
jgi:DNA-binding transcriptional regulator YiaG